MLAMVGTASATVTITNRSSGGDPVLRMDTAGNAIDAHDGGILQVGSTFYLYGTSYGCGFVWKLSGPFCGFKVYSSTDLITWTDEGFLFDATVAPWPARCVSDGTHNGCFRPHVVFNASTSKYVLWFNATDAGATDSYRVMTSPTPLGPWTEQAAPTLTGAPTHVNADENLFVDNDGTAYIIFSNVNVGTLRNFVQQLTSDYLTGTGTAVSIGDTADREGGALFRQGSTYFAITGAICGFCTGTTTVYRTASTPLGTWSSETQISADSCFGQSSFVAPLTINGSPVYLYGSDIWYNGYHEGGSGHFGAVNQGNASHFWVPLTVSSGVISAITCSATWTAALTASSVPTNPRVDQSSGTTGFATYCQHDELIDPARHMQTFIPSASYVLGTVNVSTYQSGFTNANSCESSCTPPNVGLTMDLVTVDGSNNPSGTLKSVTQFLPNWAPRMVSFTFNQAVTSGTKYGFVLHSTSTTGCYGWNFNDTNVYPTGVERRSADSGATWTTETNRALMFSDLLPLTGLTGISTLAGKATMINGGQ